MYIVPIPVEYLYRCTTAVYLHQPYVLVLNPIKNNQMRQTRMGSKKETEKTAWICESMSNFIYVHVPR